MASSEQFFLTNACANEKKTNLFRNILLFPRGNNNPHTLSIYLEFADLRDNPPPDTYACAYFAICISQPSDPTQYISQCKLVIRTFALL